MRANIALCGLGKDAAGKVLADDSIFEDLARIVEDRRYSGDRQMVVLALGKMKNPRAAKVLIGLLDDEEAISGSAVTALGKLKAQEALPLLERFLQHPRASMRQEAKKAIRRIERSKGRPK